MPEMELLLKQRQENMKTAKLAYLKLQKDLLLPQDQKLSKEEEKLLKDYDEGIKSLEKTGLTKNEATDVFRTNNALLSVQRDRAATHQKAIQARISAGQKQSQSKKNTRKI